MQRTNAEWLLERRKKYTIGCTSSIQYSIMPVRGSCSCTATEYSHATSGHLQYEYTVN